MPARPSTKKAPAKKAPAKKVVAKKVVAKKVVAKKAVAKKAVARKAPVKKAPAPRAVTKAPVAKKAAVAKRATPVKKAVRKAPGTRISARVASLTPALEGPDAGRLAGAKRREVTPRSSHAGWVPPADREDPISILERTNLTRVPELVPVRFGRMLSSPFAFYRGAPAVMAADLATTPNSGYDVQICGDAHLVNFGLFATPERHLVFDLNDFDETLPGPWEWDVKRLAASLLVAARTAGFTEDCGIEAATSAVSGYRTAMTTFAQMSQIEIWYTRTDVEDVLPLAASGQRKRLKSVIAKSRAHTSEQALGKLTKLVGGERQIIERPPLIERIDARQKAAVGTLFERYFDTMPDDRRVLLDQYRFIDAARKVVGVGSVGTRCFIALLEGKVHQGPLFLQVKQAERSVLEPHLGHSGFDSHGHRVVAGQRITQAASDLLLGWTRYGPRHFYIRQLRDMKGSFEVEGMAPAGLIAYAGACGSVLARAHARTGGATFIAGYLGSSGTFDRAIAKFAVDYADQNERDYTALVEAVAAGRVEAFTGI